jgi:membrane associated rhomboid family serine protease
MKLTVSNFPVRVLYVWAMIAVGLIVIPILWFGYHYIFWEIQPVVVAIAEDLGTNSTTFYQVDTFFQAVDHWAHLLALLALGLWGYVYSQRRGRQVW